MAQDLVKKLNDAEWQGELESLAEIAEGLFTHFCTARTEAAAEKEKNMVLLREIKQLEERNGNLQTALDEIETKNAQLRDEVEAMEKHMSAMLTAAAELKEDNRQLSEMNYQLETQIRLIRQMAAKMAKEEKGNSSSCTREVLSAWKCPKCGSMDVACAIDTNERTCNVCGTRYEVNADG